MNFQVGDIVKALVGPFVAEFGKVVLTAADGAVHVAHDGVEEPVHYQPHQLEIAQAAEVTLPATVIAAPPARKYVAPSEPGIPHSAQARKETPIATGVLAYFPDAIAEVAKVSYIGNDQHNPGQSLHWARDKSTDHSDSAARHITEYLDAKRQNPNVAVPRDAKGNSLLAQAAWRVLAQNQLDIEKEKAK